ncbi:DNA sulfur modification protein DndE [Natronospira proteinivora]|uniref:DNA sulfur modification protein DndE n=1 Tax=Natronospira proteinivora TaxID=1807133 RepID=A0ABT1G8G6_9GAMM|nr:DNA sulfur modification protein DndE [Natronospira proteinivora]MCP1727609.1 DNA sulfur modification protein DndE [Natronospira proteinivora]
MNTTIETVRLDQRCRNQLMTLKRRTKIENWNILCRWAFCMSLNEPTAIRKDVIGTELGVEMTWRTFGGEYADVYLGLLKQRCQNDGLPLTVDSVNEQLRGHIQRGVGYLLNATKDSGISEFVDLAKT